MTCANGAQIISAQTVICDFCMHNSIAVTLRLITLSWVKSKEDHITIVLIRMRNYLEINQQNNAEQPHVLINFVLTIIILRLKFSHLLIFQISRYPFGHFLLIFEPSKKTQCRRYKCSRWSRRLRASVIPSHNNVSNCQSNGIGRPVHTINSGNILRTVPNSSKHPST